MFPGASPCHWCTYDDFADSCDVRIGFKTIKQENATEHWMNRLSVNWTRRREDVEPGGSICHAEIMLHVRPGVWRRWSIAKKTLVKGTGWVPGTVHCRTVNVMNDDYAYIKVFMSRRRQHDMYNFLMSQVGGGFNLKGYALNFILPFGGFGTVRYFGGIENSRRRWFCTELITCALQAGGLSCFEETSARGMSPNGLYRLCARLSSAMPTTNPGGCTEIVL
jgi:hypothetical protein